MLPKSKFPLKILNKKCTVSRWRSRVRLNIRLIETFRVRVQEILRILKFLEVKWFKKFPRLKFLVIEKIFWSKIFLGLKKFRGWNFLGLKPIIGQGSESSLCHFQSELIRPHFRERGVRYVLFLSPIWVLDFDAFCAHAEIFPSK